MKIKAPNNAMTYPELMQKLETQFPDYEFKMRGKKVLVGSSSNTTGANIMIRKNTIFVNGSFPTMGGTMIFAMCMVLLGILIPMIIYFAVFHGKMKAFENEVGGFIQQEVDVLSNTKEAVEA